MDLEQAVQMGWSVVIVSHVKQLDGSTTAWSG